MAKPRKPMDLLEAIMALGQDVPAPKQEPRQPPPQPGPSGSIEDAIHMEIPAALEALGRLGGQIAGESGEGLRRPGGTPEETWRDITPEFQRAIKKPVSPVGWRTVQQDPQEAQRPDVESRRARALRGIWSEPLGPADPAERGKAGIWTEPHYDRQIPPLMGRQDQAAQTAQAPAEEIPGPLPGIAGARTEPPAADITDLNRPGVPTPQVDLEALIQGGHGLPAEATQDTAVEQPRGGSPFSLEDKEIEMLAKRASETKKPGILDALAVLASSINPRQTPQGSMALANQLRGEPERRGAEQSLQALLGARGRRRAEEAKAQGQIGLEGLRQQGATTRTGIQAAGGLERTRMQQQGGLQRAQVGAQSREKIAAMPQAGRGISPSQQIAQANFHALGRINAERSSVIGQLEAVRRDISADPQAKQMAMKQLQDKLSELDNLKRNAIGMLHNAGAFGDEAAAMFTLGEGEPLEGMDPQMIEAMRAYSDQLNKALPR